MILNLTQHIATPEQIEAGVFEPSAEDKKTIQKLLTFEEIPTKIEMYIRAAEMLEIANKYFNKHAEEGHGKIMIGGAPFFMGTLQTRLKLYAGYTPVYAFSKRESVDQPQPDGSVRKVQVFRHCGFVEV